MDMAVSRKIQRWQPRGAVMELVDNVFDLYPIYSNKFDPNIITDIEILDDPQKEKLDRAMFAIVKQYGNDPVDLGDGIPWAEYIIGEAPAALVLARIKQAVTAEGPGVRITPTVTAQGTDFKIELVEELRVQNGLSAV